MPGFEALLTGRVLVKRYTIGDVIGRGGFAAVYRARDERLARDVAVKVITLPAADDATREEIGKRFEREARAVASLPQHRNIVSIYDFGTDPELGLDFLVMELLHGEDLATYLARLGAPPLHVAACILSEAAAGLAVGHRAGLIHRDVKPGNLFLAEEKGEEAFRVCVLDFGIARIATEEEDLTRLTNNRAPLSPAYASPEQLRGEPDLTPASDVFSLGVVGYQLLTGQKPFAQDRQREGAAAAVRPIQDVNPSVPPEVAAVVERAMAPAPADRFPDAAAIAAALQGASGGDPTQTVRFAPAPLPPADDHTLLVEAPPRAVIPPPESRPVPAPPRSAPPPPKRRSGGGVWLLLLLLLSGAGAAAWWALSGTSDSAPAADQNADAVTGEDQSEALEPEGDLPAGSDGTFEPEPSDAVPLPVPPEPMEPAGNSPADPQPDLPGEPAPRPPPPTTPAPPAPVNPLQTQPPVLFPPSREPRPRPTPPLIPMPQPAPTPLPEPPAANIPIPAPEPIVRPQEPPGRRQRPLAGGCETRHAVDERGAARYCHGARNGG